MRGPYDPAIHGERLLPPPSAHKGGIYVTSQGMVQKHRAEAAGGKSKEKGRSKSSSFNFGKEGAEKGGKNTKGERGGVDQAGESREKTEEEAPVPDVAKPELSFFAKRHKIKYCKMSLALLDIFKEDAEEATASVERVEEIIARKSIDLEIWLKKAKVSIWKFYSGITGLIFLLKSFGFRE